MRLFCFPFNALNAALTCFKLTEGSLLIVTIDPVHNVYLEVKHLLVFVDKGLTYGSPYRWRIKICMMTPLF